MKPYKYPTKETPDVLEEPSAIYGQVNYFSLAGQAISKQYIKKILKLSGMSLSDLMEILPVSIDSYKRKTVFNPPVTEKVLEIEEVYRKGIAAFGDRFHIWMEATNPALGNFPPKALLKNSFGVRRLLDQIGRMEHGVLA